MSVESTVDFFEALRKGAPKDVVKMDLTMAFGQERKYVTVHIDLKKFPKGIEILHITDVQFGHKMCDVGKFVEYRDWVLAEPNRFVIFGGDMIDAATLMSVGSPLENDGEPQDQVYQFVKLAMPFRHRILGYVGGNHERRTSKTFGEAGRLIANYLGIPYSTGKQFIDVYYGEHKAFKISNWHGGGAGRTKGAKCMMLHRFMQQGDSSVYLVGHLHDTLLVGDVRENRGVGGKIELVKIFGLMSSSFLNHYGTYAEVAGMSAGDTNMWRIVLDPNGKWMVSVR